MPALSIQPSEICPRFDREFQPALGASVSAWGAYRRRFPPPPSIAAAPEPRKAVEPPVEPVPLTPAERMAAIPRQRTKLTPRYIQALCAAFYDVAYSVIISGVRIARIVRPRQVAMYLIRKHLGKSFPELGRMFGGRDHTTAMHSYRKTRNAIYRGGTLRAEVEAIEQVIVGEAG